MSHPLSYGVFLAVMVLAAVCLAALLYVSYRRSAKLRDIVGFVVSPDEHCAADLKAVSIISSVMWLLVVNISCSLGYHILDMCIFNASAPQNSIGQALAYFPLWVILLLPPVLEETAFRLPLKRKRIFTALSAAAVAFIVTASVFSTKVYDVTWPRAAACAVIGLAFWLWGYKWIRRVDFRVWFWFMALLFSILHVMNYGADITGAEEWLRVIFRECAKLPSALILGYIRLKHGFMVSVAIHFFNNLIPFVLMNAF